MKEQINLNPIDYIPVIYDCNDNCISCPVSRKGERKNPDYDNIIKDIDKILKYSDHISFNGGEPTLRNDIINILKYTEKKDAKEIFLLTNSKSFYYEKLAKEISLINNLKIITTLYGGSSKIHDSITRTPNSFKYKIQGLKNLIKYNVNIELRILIHKMNYKHFDDTIEFIINNFKNKDFINIIIMSPKLTNIALKHKNIVSEKISIIGHIIEEPVKKLLKNAYNVKIFHFPHCILSKDLWELSCGITADEIEIIFCDKCKDCILKEKCSGIWKSYFDIYGDEEFNPIMNLD
jgi:MoaA/NifB/PqqE/SkfB family radical SAM enzyme